MALISDTQTIGDMDLAGFGDQHAAVYSIVSYPFLSYLHSSQ